MKKIVLSWDAGWHAKAVLLAVVSQAQDGARYDEVLKRMRIIDALDEVKENDEALYLEDADWELLKTIVQSFRYTVVSKELRSILKSVMEAKDGRRPVESERVPERPAGVPAGGTGVPNDKLDNGRAGVDTGGESTERVDARGTKNGYMDTRGAEDEYVER